ncbi:hypothetical protein D3C81_1728860 [compost metagenome]
MDDVRTFLRGDRRQELVVRIRPRQRLNVNLDSWILLHEIVGNLRQRFGFVAHRPYADFHLFISAAVSAAIAVTAIGGVIVRTAAGKETGEYQRAG